jgi:Ca2+-binding RTX toxin-like protein
MLPRSLAAAGVTALLALAAAVPAGASSVAYVGDTLVFSAAPGERNFVVVDGDDNGSLGFSIPGDRSFEIDGGPGADLITGPRNGVGSATLDGGDGNDTLRDDDGASPTPDLIDAHGRPAITPDG